jgi:hypothetical protein
MRAPLRQFCTEENVSERFARYENKAGRLTFSYVGNRVFITDEDREAWRKLARKSHGNNAALQLAEQALKALGEAVKAGDIDRRAAVRRLQAVTAASGLDSEQVNDRLSDLSAGAVGVP